MDLSPVQQGDELNGFIARGIFYKIPDPSGITSQIPGLNLFDILISSSSYLNPTPGSQVKYDDCEK